MNLYLTGLIGLLVLAVPTGLRGQLPNDEPCGATELTLTCTTGGQSGTTAGATRSAGIPDPVCSDFRLASDVWFKFTLTETTDVRLTTQAGTLSDAVLQVFAATSRSATLREVGCNDDPSPGNTMPVLRLQNLSSGLYFVRVSGIGGAGTFSLCAGTTPPLSSAFEVCDSLVLGLSPTTITYTGNASAGAKYYWVFDGGFAQPGNGPGPHRVTFPTTGRKTLALTVEENGAVSATSSQVLFVSNTAQAPTARFSVGNLTLCKGQTTNLAVRCTGRGPWTLAYSERTGSTTTPRTVTFGEASSCNPTTVTIPVAPTASTTYQLTSLRDANLSTPTTLNTSVVVTVNDTPLPTFSLSADKTMARVGEAVTVRYQGSSGSDLRFSWNFDGGTATPGTGAGPHSVTWTNSGTRRVTLNVVQGACTTATASVSVTVSNPSLANDDPCGATELTPVATCGFITTTNAGATASGGFGKPDCFTEPITNDVWYRFTLAASAEVLLSTQAGTLDDLALQVFRATACDRLPVAALACNDAAVGNLPVLSLKGLLAGTYWVRAWSTAGKTGTFGLCLRTKTTPLPTASWQLNRVSVCAGDTAKAPLTLTGTGPWMLYWTRTTGGVSRPDSIVLGSGFSGSPYEHTVLFKPSATTTYQLTGVRDAYSARQNASGSLEVSLPNLGALTTTYTLSTTSPALNAPLTLTYTGNAGSTVSYEWDFDGATVVSGSGAGPYSLKWDSPGRHTLQLALRQGACLTPVRAQVVTVGGTVHPFDKPCDARSLPIQTTFCEVFSRYSTEKATATPDSVKLPGCSSGAQRSQFDVWFKFTLTASQRVVVAFEEGTLTYPTIQVLAASACGGPYTSVACREYTTQYRVDPVELTNLAAGTYFVRVWGQSQSTGTFGLCLSSINEPPPTFKLQSTPSTLCQGDSAELAGTLTGTGPWTLIYEEKPENGAASTRTVMYGTARTASPAFFRYALRPGQTTLYTPKSLSDARYPTPQPLTAGSFTVRLNLIAIPTVSLSLGDTLLGLGKNTTLTVNGTADASQGDAFQWNFDGGEVRPGAGQGPHAIRWEAVGRRQISLTVNRENCPAVTVTRAVTVVAGNDTPCDAVTLPIGACVNAALYSTVGATPTTATLPTCQTGGGRNDVWFRFTTTTVQSLVVRGVGGSLSFPTLQVLSAASCTGPFTAVGCATGGSTAQPEATLNNLPPGTYYLRYWSGTGLEGTFGVCVGAVAPPTARFVSSDAEVCQNSDSTRLLVQLTGRTPWKVELRERTAVRTSTRILTISRPATDEPYLLEVPVRPSATTTYRLLSISDASGLPVQPLGDSLVLRVDVETAPRSQFTASPASVTTGQETTLTLTTKPAEGVSYRWEFDLGTITSGTGAGPYRVKWANPGSRRVRLEASKDGGCVSTTENLVMVSGVHQYDNACQAIELPVAAVPCMTPPVAYTTQGATVTTGLSVCYANQGADVWFKFTQSASRNVLIRTLRGSMINGALQLFSGAACTNLSALRCDDNSGEDGMPELRVTALAAGTYYVRVWGATAGSFGVCVSAFEAPVATLPARDTLLCRGAGVPLQLTGTGPWRVTYRETLGAQSTPRLLVLGDETTNSPALFALPVPSSSGPVVIELVNISDATFPTARTATGRTTVTQLNELNAGFSFGTATYGTGQAASVTLAVPPTPGATYTWDFQDGIPNTSNLAQPTGVIWQAPGERSVALTVQRAGCETRTTTQKVAVTGPHLFDEPCQSLTLLPNATSYRLVSNAGATTSAGGPPPTCSPGPVPGDVWFSFTLNTESDVVLRTAENSLTDGGLQLLRADKCDGPYTELRCSTEGADEEDAGLMPLLEYNSLATGTYYVRFWSPAGERGLFGVRIEVAAPRPPTASFGIRADTLCSTALVEVPIRLTGKGPWSLNYQTTPGAGMQTSTFGTALSRGPLSFALPTPTGSQVYTIRSVSDANFTSPVMVNDTFALVVAKPLTQALSITGPVQACIGASASFSALIADGTRYRWQLNSNPAIEAVGNPLSISLATAGTFILSLTPSNVCGSGTASTLTLRGITKPEKPTVRFASGILTAEPPTGIQWFLDGNPLNGATGASVTPVKTGDYSARTTNACGDGPFSDAYKFVVTGTAPGLGEVTVCPNPAREFLTVTLPPASGASEVRLTTTEGKTVRIGQPDAVSRLEFKTNDLPTGLYILWVRTPDRIGTYKIFILH